MGRGRWLVGGGLAALLLLGTGCGMTGAGGPQPIRIGTLLSPALQVGPWLSAVKAAAREANAHGGIHGRPVQVDNCDDHVDPNLAQQCARKLASDHVIATTGDFTEFGNVEAPLLDQDGIPEVGPFTLSQEESKLPTSFPWQGGNINTLVSLMFGIKRRGLTTLYMAAWDVPAEIALVQTARNFAARAGIQIVGQELIPSVATNYSSYVRQAIDAHSDAFYAAMPPAAQINFLATARTLGAKFVVALPEGELSPDDRERVGGAQAVIEGDIEYGAFPPVSASAQFPALRTFQRDMDAEYRAGDKDAAPGFRSGGAMAAWLSAQIVIHLARKLPSVTAATLLKALQTSTNVDTLGLTVPWNPNQPGPPQFPRSLVPSGWFSSQTHGDAVLTDPAPFDTFQAMGYPG